MRKSKRSSIIIIMFCILLLGLGSGLSVKAAAENYQLTDQAGLLTASEASAIEKKIEKLEKKTGWDIMAVTTKDTEGMTAVYYAEKWFDDYTTCDDGIICLIDMDNRKLILRTFGEAIEDITDKRADKILDAGYKKVSNEEYAKTFEVVLEKSAKYAYKHITLMEALVVFIAALAAGGITVGGIIGSYRLKFGGYKYSIEKNGSVNLSRKEDSFVNQFVTHRHIEKSDGNGGGGSTTHVGAGGRTSGGGSRDF